MDVGEEDHVLSTLAMDPATQLSSISPPPPLNWVEIAYLAQSLDQWLADSWVDQVFVPRRPEYPDHYRRAEWALRLRSPSGSQCLSVHLAAPRPSLELHEAKAFRAAADVPQSAFMQALTKNLEGARLRRVDSVDRERILIFWFDTRMMLGLVVGLLPQAPFSVLVSGNSKQNPPRWPVLAQSTRPSLTDDPTYTLPDGANAPWVRSRFPNPDSLRRYFDHLAASHRFGAWDARCQSLRNAITHQLARTEHRRQRAIAQSLEPADYAKFRRYGRILQSNLGLEGFSARYPAPNSQIQEVLAWDYEAQQEICVPVHPTRSLPDQMEWYFQEAKRQAVRRQEADKRLAELARQAATTLQLQENLKHLTDQGPDGDQAWSQMDALAKAVELETGAKNSPAQSAKHPPTIGRVFRSQDRFAIWAGRNLKENLHLSFRLACGNDLWLHVRGKPSAHVIIVQPQNQKASLETLLDGFQILLHYSGGKDWGKTEVIVTHRKYVTRIRKTNQVTYTHEKSWIVEYDPIRLQSLLGQYAKG